MKTTAAISCIQITMGKRISVMPGARMLSAVVRKFMPPRRNEANSNARASNHRSMP
jgi:hypothetical protein